MRNPFRGEPDAFRFLLLATGALVPVAVAAAVGPAWLGITLLVLAFVALAARLLQLRAHRSRRRELALRSAPAHVGAPDEHRVLFVASDTLEDDVVVREVQRHAALPGSQVRVLAPVVVSARARWAGDVDDAREQTRGRLAGLLGRLGSAAPATGEVAEADALQAIEDALATFPADEIVVSTRSDAHLDGLDPRLAELARERFAVPVVQVPFEPELEAAPASAR